VRVRPRHARLGEERGATLVIVAIVLVALIGMLSLVVDGGAMLMRRRGMVTASDAASLAAALSCARKEGTAGAEAQADFYATGNQSIAIRDSIVFDPTCESDAGKVTVTYHADQELFFSQVVGFGPTATARTQATAAWGGAGGAVNVAPLMLSQGRLVTGCEIPPPDPNQTGQICAFWWNNSPASNQTDLANAEWALMNLDKWGVADGITRFSGSCSNAGFSSYDSWIDSGYPGALLLDDPPPPPPTYVCRDSGNFGGALDNTIEDAIARGDPLYFPVNDPQQQVDQGGNYCPPGSSGCIPSKYAIVGFGRLQLIALYKGNTAGAQQWCSEQFVRDANARCLVAQWVGYETGGLVAGGGTNFGLIAVQLTE